MHAICGPLELTEGQRNVGMNIPGRQVFWLLLEVGHLRLSLKSPSRGHRARRKPQKVLYLLAQENKKWVWGSGRENDSLWLWEERGPGMDFEGSGCCCSSGASCHVWGWFQVEVAGLPLLGGLLVGTHRVECLLEASSPELSRSPPCPWPSSGDREMASVLTHNSLQTFEVTFPPGPNVAWPQRRTLRTGQCVSSVRSQLGLRSLQGNSLLWKPLRKPVCQDEFCKWSICWYFPIYQKII